MKLKNQITINLDDSQYGIVLQLAELYQRKPAELVRLLLIPKLWETFNKEFTTCTTEEAHWNPTPFK